MLSGLLELLFKNTHLLSLVKGVLDFIEDNSCGEPLTKISLEYCVDDYHSTKALTCFRIS